jgi:predicted amidohydrolase YtcJ
VSTPSADAAIALTVDAYDRVLRDFPCNGHRHYLCRFRLLPPDRTIGPMVGRYRAVTREGMNRGKVYSPEEAVRVRDAIRMGTRNGAYLTWEEKPRGRSNPED